ncbi:lactate utilization protein C [Campylobacter sp. VBCF_05 NA6]|uniref:LutC/YkgG family protein n=1 Tax=unclassified Campylobacter TaxID=2593542 RepID=UPI001B4833C3|nr:MULTISPECIES: lactate utilization protein C [unclassified Campylobacter]MBP3224358.1 lactate utilization protein C [Campylobacter sp.]MDA3057453.1 lactate utilization protein C [Campylobacter sp. VBCF_04 NA7]MDA3058975.1 lactate utilization protein C [Campylobacter sp. VBCF_05 NA6]
MSSKETILAKIRSNRVAKRTEIEPLDITKFVENEGDKYENFKTNLTNNKAVVHETDEKGLQALVEEIVKTVGAKTVMFGSDLPIKTDKLQAEKLPFDKPVNEIREALFDADTSIIEAKLGVSNFGVCCVVSSKAQPRLLSLLPTNCIILLRKNALVESLDKALAEVTKDELPTNINFIMGPSRTADIELITVLGVHGPRNVHVVLY